MSGTSFTQIPSNWNVPGARAEIVPIRSGTSLSSFPVRALVIGPMLAGGTAAAGSIQTMTSGLQADALFGAGSALAQACRAFILTSPFVPLDAIGVAAPAGATAATAPVPLTGTITAAGTAALYVNGQRVEFEADPVGGLAGAAANLVSAIAAAPSALGCSAATIAAGAGQLATLTSLGTGAVYNDLDIRVSPFASDTVPGLVLSPEPFSGGSGLHDISLAIAVSAGTWYTDIVCCTNDATALADLATETARRYNAMTALDAQAYYGKRGTYAQALALSETVNSPFMSCIPASQALWATWQAAATFGAACAQQLNTDPARSLRTVPLTALNGLAPASGDLYLESQRNVLLGQGMSTFRVAIDGSVSIERAVTNYQLNLSGLPDTAWRDIMVPKTMTRVRYDWNAYVDATWPQAKLVPDSSTIALEYAANVVSPGVLKASWVARSTLYEQQGWLENTATLSPTAVFGIDANDNDRVDAAIPVQVIGSLMNLMSSLQFEV